LGLAGICSQGEQQLMETRLRPLVDGHFALDEDAAAAQAGAFAGGEGVVCIAGTGANCFGINSNGDRARADGLGPLLGDRGSGYSIGENALRAACAADDGSGPQTSLLPSVLNVWKITSVDEIVQMVYAPDWKRDRTAALFPIVLREAAAGDAVSLALLEDAGNALAATATAVLRKLDIRQVAVTGGVLTQDSAVRRTFESALQNAVPGVRITEPKYDAAIGAALLLEN
ncbi:MAG TPA: BadF/BadG/BcrA/BcrD ATPase family protein, partial [Abditibacteriaceae bacterium]